MATIYVEGNPYEVDDSQNLLQACLSLGFNLPYFCWHPALGSVGACRQCAVKQFKDEDDTQGKIVMACMTPASDGTRISIDDPEARHFRETVIEWLMVNHPHDCPVCDEGGECHLQDMTVLTGHTYREFRFDKRTHRNQYLGPFVNHEMNRCIACYRCVRFYRGYAGGRDLDVFAAHDYVYFGRYDDGALESEFSGNLVEVCPTGVFTDKTLKQHYTRKWDLQTAPSVCVHCGLGCNILPGERYGLLRRIRNRYNHQVNGYFLCDRGRYGYEFVNSAQRVRTAMRRTSHDAPVEPIDTPEAVRHVAGLISPPGRVLGIGSPRASLEANFVLRTLVGPDRFYLGVSPLESRLLAVTLDLLRSAPARVASLHDVARADAVFVLGEDVSNTAPRLALALRRSVRQQPLAVVHRYKIPDWDDAAVREVTQEESGPLYLAMIHGSRLDDVATRTYRAAPDDLARLGFAVAHAIDGAAPAVDDLPDEVAALAQEIAAALQGVERPLVVSGTGCGSEAVLQAAGSVARALERGGRAAGLCLAVPECNSLGLALMGGPSLEEALRAVRGGEVDTVIVLENDLYRRADPQAVHDLFSGARHVVALDHLGNPTANQAELVLPAATFAESSGTLVNNEGRAQRFYAVFEAGGHVQASWRWLRDVMLAAGRAEAQGWQTLDDVVAAMAQALPALAAVAAAAPPNDLRLVDQKVPRQPHRYSGRTAMHAHLTIHEPPPPPDPDSPLAFSMEGYHGQPPPALIPRYWAPNWNSVQALNKFQEEIAGPLRGGSPGAPGVQGSVRLIEPGDQAVGEYADSIPAAFHAHAGEWLIVPLHHIFGSEPLSMFTPGVSELAPGPYLALNPYDAARLGAAAGDEVEVDVEGQRLRLPLKLLPTLPQGVAGLPAGLPTAPALATPGRWLTISTEVGDE